MPIENSSHSIFCGNILDKISKWQQSRSVFLIGSLQPFEFIAGVPVAGTFLVIDSRRRGWVSAIACVSR
jgi:hypothetical protein